MFTHAFIEPVEVATRSIGGRRYYDTPVGRFPSVTTIIGEFLDDKEYLQAWRNRVGDAEADRITGIAARRGTAIHNLCEQYLLNNLSSFKLKKEMPVNIETFRNIQPYLDANVDIIYGLEYPLYSETLNTAGRTDMFCQWNGVNSIVDFKTSRWPKKEEDILGYFIQSSCYAMMMESLNNFEVPQIVIVIAVDNEPAQLFVKQRRDYEDQVIDVFVTKRLDAVKDQG